MAIWYKQAKHATSAESAPDTGSTSWFLRYLPKLLNQWTSLWHSQSVKIVAPYLSPIRYF